MKLKRLLALVLALGMILSVLPMTVGAASCETGDHAIVYVPAKAPTYTEMGWAEYELCENCEYSTFAGFIPSLGGEPVIDSYEDFVFNLALLEEIAYEYVRMNPGKDPVALVIKYIRTGVERYNSGSWGIMAGYEDADFAKFVTDIEAMLNAESTDGTYLKVTGLKNLERFYLPNGDKADIGHVFGSMDITYHNKGSVNHADVSGWAGDLVDLLEVSDINGVSGELDAMIKEVAENYLGVDHTPNPGMSQEDVEGDLDAFYIMETLYENEYEVGKLAEIFMYYYTEELDNAHRADYFLKNRLETTGTRTQVRNSVYNAYIGNKVITTLEGTREFKSSDLTDLRKAVCYSFADYLCELAGDYVPDNKNEFYNVFESSSSVLAPGIVQESYRATSADGKQMVYYVATADITRDDVHLFANYNNADPSKWEMSRVLDQALAAQKKYGDPESPDYIKNYNVIVSTNGDGFNMSTGEPGGLLVMDGKEWHGINSSGFFGVTKEGKAIIGTTAEYNNIYRGQLKEAIGGFGMRLIKDGKIVVSKSANYTSNRASRTAAGITKTGKVVLIVVDGRQEPYSCGGSMEEIAQILFEAGCVDAINLDGGGSTTMVARPQGEDLQVISSPSDGAARSVSTTLLMVSTAPSSTAFDHANLESDYKYSTIGTEIKITPVGISETGNVTNLPEGYTWAVSDSRWGKITEDGVFTGLRNGSVDVYLMLDGAVIGSTTMNVVTPESVYFTKKNIAAVYGSTVTLPVAALYEGKSVAISESDVIFMLDNEKAGSFDGFKFTAKENSGIKNTKATVMWADEAYEVLPGTITINIYKQGENSFDFDKATGGDRILGFDRVVTNSTTDDNVTYVAVDTSKDMTTSYIFAMDMTQIPIPQRLNDLIYMLPGADMENASAWNFLLQLAERISDLTEVTPELRFDPRFEVDYSELKVMNEYFNLMGTTFDEETNTLTLNLRWIKQSKAIDPATANPLCLVSGIKLTPKEGAFADSNRMNVVHFGKISYKVYMRASALYSFAQKPENQEVFGILPFVNPNLTSEKGGYFGDVYKEFEDTYTLLNAKKSGWYAEDGGFAYYVEGERVTGVNKIGDYYYSFNENGINDGQTKFTGSFYDKAAGVYRFAKLGSLVSGWQSVGNDWYYFDTTTYAAAVGQRKLSGVKYQFEVTGKLKSGVWMNVFTGWRYYYGPDYYRTKWQQIDGDWYYFRNGLRVTGMSEVTAMDNVMQRRWYDFGEDGKSKGLITGIVNAGEKIYWIEDGKPTERGLFKLDGDYYYAQYDGSLITNKSYYAWKLDPTSELPKGTYEFGADGKMLGANEEGGVSGIVEKDGVLYYYVNGKPTEMGLFKLGDDHYYAQYDGSLITNRSYYAWKLDQSAELPKGTYEFGADGKMLQDIVEKDGVLYCYKDGKPAERGLFKLDGNYYYSQYDGTLIVNKTYYAWKQDATSDLPNGTYEFGADGKMYDGIVNKNGALYYYEIGKPVERGLFKLNGDYYYSQYDGKLITNQKYYAWKLDKTSDLAVGNYEFGADGKMLQGIVNKNGVLYYYVNGNPKEMGLFKIGDDYYYSQYNGTLIVGKRYYVWKHHSSSDLTNGHYEFDENGKMIQGIVPKNGKLYYYVNGNPTEMGLFKIGDDYYYSQYDGTLITGKRYYVWKHHSSSDLTNGHYEFDENGKMIQGIINKGGVLYYYENGNPTEKGLFKIGDDYYYSQYDGSLITGKKYYVWKHHTSSELPNGTYEFDENGKMLLNGIIEKNGNLYYYVNGKPTEMGLFMIDGYYYYSQYDGMLITNKQYYVWKGNDLLMEKTYTFNELGQIIG